MIKYSIIIITYNQKQILEKTLRSLSKQIKTPKIFEIVIADDCSTDNTDKFVKNARVPVFFKYFRSDKNIGRSEIRNLAFEKTVGKNVIFIDGDMVPSDNMIESYLKSWDKYPGAVIAGGWEDPADFKNDPLHKYLVSRGRFRFGEECKIPSEYFTSGNFSINRDLFREMNGFDPDFEGWKGEDTDFGIRLEKKSVPIVYNPNALAVHFHKRTLSDVLSDYDRYGRSSFKVLLNKYPNIAIFEKGWILGFPDSNISFFKKILRTLVVPAQSGLALGLLKRLAGKSGKLPFAFMYSWLFYGTMARSYKQSL